ncbi:MAG: Heparinase II/III family protein [uncultured bacterium]|nr:MAG: Heparinase II/III family protein [uncultured bacterium]
MLRKSFLYFNTLKHLKFKQIYYRLFYFFYNPISVSSKKNIKLDINLKNTALKFNRKNKIYLDNNKITFINHSVDITDKTIWNDASQTALWLYNLHYFDGLNVLNKDQQAQFYTLLNRWIDENIPCSNISWNSFVLSLRIVNIIKYALSGNYLSEKVLYSLYLQVRTLYKKCEYHLLGNHLFENFKALCIAGLFFNSSEATDWFHKGFHGLQKEIQEQVLKDGGHFELSAMYHVLFLEGLLDLHLIFNYYGREFIWKNIVEKMLHWLVIMERSDDEIPYFNDSANQTVTDPHALCDYAKRLGYFISSQQKPLNYLAESGFVIANTDQFRLIMDVGNIGSDYLPAHAHADSLSFELLVFKNPVFINLGTSCYGDSARRLFERSTAAHNTVVVNEKNSSDVWSGFRVGKRAYIKNVKIIEKNNFFCIEASHDGYQHCLHKRTWEIFSDKIIIKDHLSQKVKSAFAYFHCHPNCQIVSQAPKKIILQLKNGLKIYFETENEYSLIESEYAQAFGDIRKTKSICVKLDNDNQVSKIRVERKREWIQNV